MKHALISGLAAILLLLPVLASCAMPVPSSNGSNASYGAAEATFSRDEDCSDDYCVVPSFDEAGSEVYAIVSPVGYCGV